MTARPSLRDFVRLAEALPPTDGALRRWMLGLSAFGKVACVRGAIASARIALEVWERHYPSLRAPHDRIAAAETWLACPCRRHAKAARVLAFANGDDNPVREGGLVVAGAVITNREAVFAHWASDNAASAAASSDDVRAAISAGTAASAAAVALEFTGLPFEERVKAVTKVIVRALQLPLPVPTGLEDEGPASPGRRLPVLLASADADDDVERRLLETIEANPADDEARTVYGDWLEERGRHDEAEFVRVQLELKKMTTADDRFRELSKRLRQLASKADPVWRRALARPAIEKCELKYELVCPRHWDSLAVTDKPGERFCNTCMKSVHYASTIERARALAASGACVAVDVALFRHTGDLDPPQARPMLMGAVAPPRPIDVPPRRPAGS